MPERIELSVGLRDALLRQDSLPTSLLVNGKTYTPEAPVAAGHKGAIWRARDEHGRQRALKLCIHHDYHERSYLQEVTGMSRGLLKFGGGSGDDYAT